METFTERRGFVPNPSFPDKRRTALEDLDLGNIDPPIVDIIRDFTGLPHCYTLQSCFGHFVYSEQSDPHNLDRLPIPGSNVEFEYRIAYLALCLQNSPEGKRLHDQLAGLTKIDPEYIQFGCAGWFWQSHVNSFVLQVEPERYRYQDSATMEYQEALHLEQVRDRFFNGLRNILSANRI